MGVNPEKAPSKLWALLRARALCALETCSVPAERHVIQGGPSASGKGYVDSKFEVAFSY